MKSIIKENHRKRTEYRQAFFCAFGVSFDDYFHPLLGFDLIKFDDEFLRSPDDESVANYLTEHYGKLACKLVENII